MSYEWSFSTPEAEGMNSLVLNQLDDYLKQKRYRLVNSVLVVKNGKIVFERYYNKFHENSRHHTRSIWKSILAIATGICLDKGIIGSLDEPIAQYLGEFTLNIHPYHKLITIRHLLTMSSGIYWNGGIHYHCPMLTQMMRTSDWTSYIADIDMNRVPGVDFQYKEWDVMLLSALIGRAYGGTAYDIVKPYLYEPLDITSGEWSQSPCGFSYHAMKGEEQSDLSARDLAKIGLLFLDKGKFNGQQIVSTDFVNEAVHRPGNYITFGPSADIQSYGYLWWLFPNGFGCRGSGGQEVTVIPDSNYVAVIQATPTAASKSYGDIQDHILSKAIIV